MLFHIIEISQNFSKSPQWMPRGHIFLLTWNGEVSPCHGRRMMGSVGQHPRGASQGSILAFPLHLVASGVIPPSRAKPSAVEPLHLSCPSNSVYFFPLWMLGFPCCSEQAAAPVLAGRQERGVWNLVFSTDPGMDSICHPPFCCCIKNVLQGLLNTCPILFSLLV